MILVIRISDIWPRLEKIRFMPYPDKKGTDQPAHPCSLISAFIVCCLDSIVSLVSVFAISLLSLASVAQQAGLSLEPKQVFS